MRGWMMVVVMMNKKVKGNKITRNEDNIFLPSSAGSSVGGPITPGWRDEGARKEGEVRVIVAFQTERTKNIVP